MINELLRKRKENKGFTLIELIVVIAILAILAAILAPRYLNFTDNAKVSRLASDTRTISKAIATYYADKGILPGNAAALVDAGLLPAQPKDLGTIDGEGAFTMKVNEATKLSAFCDKAGNFVICKDGTAAVVGDLDATGADDDKNEGDSSTGGGKIKYQSSRH